MQERFEEKIITNEQHAANIVFGLQGLIFGMDFQRRQHLRRNTLNLNKLRSTDTNILRAALTFKYTMNPIAHVPI